MEKELKAAQAELDKIEKKLVDNKKARLAAGGGSDELKAEAIALRDEYITQERVREDLLKKVLGDN